MSTINKKRLQRKSILQSPTSTSKRHKPQQSSNCANTVVPPQIPGVTPEVVPVLLDAIKFQKKHLRSNRDNADGLLHGDQTNNSSQTISSGFTVKSNSSTSSTLCRGGAKESILARIGKTECSERQFKLKEHRIIADEYIDRLLQALSNHGGTKTAPDEIIACLEFVHDMVIDKKCKTLLRRSAVRVMGSLLEKFALCRSWFCEEGSAQRAKLLNYCIVLGQTNHSTSQTHRTNQRTKEENSCVQWMQQEALLLLHSLANRYGHRQPKWIVATRYMEEQNGINLSTDTTGCDSVGMGLRRRHAVERRKIRDIAIKYAAREYERVTKILNRVDECFQVLVPRFGDSANISRPTILAKTPCACLDTGSEAKSNCSDDDEIDWEDGDDTHDIIDNNENQDFFRQEDHKLAVEHTLAVMAHTGAISEGGLSVNINFDSIVGISDGGNLDNKQDLLAARRILNRCVEILNTRHAPRLTDWIDAILGSDNMTDHTADSSVSSSSSKALHSLVMLPSSVRKRKGQVLHMLMDLKRDVVQTLASATRIDRIEENCLGQDLSCSSMISPSFTTEDDNKSEVCVSEESFLAVKEDVLNQPLHDTFGMKNAFYDGTKNHRFIANINNSKKHGHAKVKIKLRPS